MSSYENAVQRICEVFDSLSPTDQRIASFILDNRDSVPTMAMRELADGVGTSSPTVSRFVKRLGYDDFAGLRLALARSNASSALGGLRSADSVSLETFEESLNYIFQMKSAELYDTVRQLDEKTVRDVLDLLNGADTVLFTGVGNTLTIAANASFKFTHLGIRTVAPSTTENANAFSLTLRKNDVLFLISSSGISKRLERILDNAEDRGVQSVLITATADSPLAKRATYVLKATTRDQLFTHGIPFSQITINFIVEALFIFLASEREDLSEHAALFNRTYEGLDKKMDLQSGEFIDALEGTEVEQ